MGQDPSKMFLDNIHKVVIYNPVALSYLAFNIIHKLFEWPYSSKKIKGKTTLPFKKETKCPACKKKEPSSQLPTILHKTRFHSNQFLRLQNVQINMVSYLATKKLHFKDCAPGRPRKSASSWIQPEMIPIDSVTDKSTALNVKTGNKYFRSMSPSLFLGLDDEMKQYGLKTHDEQQISNVQQTKELSNDLFSPPVPTNSNFWEHQEYGELKHMPGVDLQEQTRSPIKSPLGNVSKLKMHFLRKIFENLMMSYPKIVQRSVQAYNENCQISSNWKKFSVPTQPYLDYNAPERTPKLKSDTPVQNVTPLSKNTIAVMGYCSNTVPEKVPLPFTEKSNSKKLKSFKRSKRQSRKETDLPINTILHFGIKTMQTLSPDICIDKSHIEITNRTANYKIQNPFLEPGIKEDLVVERSKQTTNINNKLKEIEEDESNDITIPKSQERPITGVTSHICANPVQEPHVSSNSLVDDQCLSTKMIKKVTSSCSEGKTSTRPLHTTVSDNTSIFRHPVSFNSFRTFLLNTIMPNPHQRRLLSGRTTKELCERQKSL
ncbi:uncharacterized protein ACNLHF_014429 isoform 2-T3 [Anomaloglossus baeobatrachus]|uniref:uncharacterized protein LOC142301837 isoform X1 n=2 Tax=Anomaloglossus baeobatrachus TaxID=238106 RepID=UPI003F4FF3E3